MNSFCRTGKVVVTSRGLEEMNKKLIDVDLLLLDN